MEGDPGIVVPVQKFGTGVARDHSNPSRVGLGEQRVERLGQEGTGCSPLGFVIPRSEGNHALPLVILEGNNIKGESRRCGHVWMRAGGVRHEPSAGVCRSQA